jgi:hypothetical protein
MQASMDFGSTSNTKSRLLLDFGRGAQACCLGSMDASKLISLHMVGTAISPSCAMQSPISKRHWYDGSKTKKNGEIENLDGQRENSAIKQNKNCFKAVSPACKK